MEIFTVAFFGHRVVDNALEIELRLDKELERIITTHEITEFLVGRNGDFDMLASSTVRRAAKRFGSERVVHILVLPYLTAEFIHNKESFLDFYDEVELCEKAANGHFLSAIQTRNRFMADRADLVICCIQHESGGAYKSVSYAKRNGKAILNLHTAVK